MIKKGILSLTILAFAAFTLQISLVLALAPWPVFQGNQEHTGLSPYDTSHVNGAVKWTFETGEGIESSPTIGEDGTIFFGSHDGYLYALNPDGTLKWKFKPAEPIYDEGGWKHYSAIVSSPTIASDGTVYIIAPDDYFYAVKDGKEKWRFPLKWDAINFWTSASIGTDGTIYVGSARADMGDKLVAGFYALTPDGKEKWHYEINSGVTSTPVIAKDGTIYVNGNILKKTAEDTTAGGYLFALAQDGKLKWKFKMQDWVETSPSLGDDGTVYTGSKEGRVYAINPDGTLRWAFSANDGIGGAPAIGKDGTIYVGSWDNNFYALNPDGTERWSYEVEPGFETIGASAAIGSDGTIYFGTTKGFFYALNPDGTKKWKIANMASIASSPAIGKDGTIYIGSWNKKMYAIGAGEASAEDGTPEVCHTRQLAREVKFDKEPANTCIEGTCDSYSTICPKKGLDGKCAAPMEACISKDCKKYRSYCHLIVKDLEGRTGGDIIFKENYVTADGQKHFIKEMKVFLSPKQERSIGWYYEVDADKLGYCDYSDLTNPICKPKEIIVARNFTSEQTAGFKQEDNTKLPEEGAGKEAETGGKEETAKIQKNFFSRLIGWITRLFRGSDELSPERAPKRSDVHPDLEKGGPGGCKSRPECQSYCSRPENRKECSKFTPPD